MLVYIFKNKFTTLSNKVYVRKWTLQNHPNLRHFIIQMCAHDCLSDHLVKYRGLASWTQNEVALTVACLCSFLQCWMVDHCLQKKVSDCIILFTFGVGWQFLTSICRGRLLRNSCQFWKFIRTVWNSQVTKVCLREKKGKVPEAENWIHKWDGIRSGIMSYRGRDQKNPRGF